MPLACPCIVLPLPLHSPCLPLPCPAVPLPLPCSCQCLALQGHNQFTIRFLHIISSYGYLGPLPFNSWSNSTYFWKIWPGFPLQGNTLPMESRVSNPRRVFVNMLKKKRRIQRNTVEVELWRLKLTMLSFFKCRIFEKVRSLEMLWKFQKNSEVKNFSYLWKFSVCVCVCVCVCVSVRYFLKKCPTNKLSKIFRGKAWNTKYSKFTFWKNVPQKNNLSLLSEKCPTKRNAQTYTHTHRQTDGQQDL